MDTIHHVTCRLSCLHTKLKVSMMKGNVCQHDYVCLCHALLPLPWEIEYSYNIILYNWITGFSLEAFMMRCLPHGGVPQYWNDVYSTSEWQPSHMDTGRTCTCIGYIRPRKFQGRSPRYFLGFTQAQTFPTRYNGSYYMFGRDITNSYHALTYLATCCFLVMDTQLVIFLQVVLVSTFLRSSSWTSVVLTVPCDRKEHCHKCFCTCLSSKACKLLSLLL